MIIANIFLAICLLLIIFEFYMLYRNAKTCDFLLKVSKDLRDKLISDCETLYDKDVDYYYSIFPSYHKVLWSFKPLKAEYHLSKELYNYIYG